MLFPSYRTIDHRNNLTSHPWRWLVLPQMQVEILITQAEQIERERRRALLNEYELEFFSLQHQNFVQSEAALAMNPGLKQGQVAVVVDDAATARTRMSSVATSAVHNPSEQVSHVDGEPLIHEDNQVSHVFSQPPPELEPGVAGIASSSGGTGNFAWDDPAHRRFQSSVPPVQINQKNYLIGQQVPDQMVFAGVPPYKARLGTATPYPLLSDAEISTSTATAMFLRRLAGETIGTFLLVFLCTFLMAESLAPQYSTLGWHVDWTGNALGQGLILVFLTLALGEVCGAHFNPCVTWSFALVGKFPFRWVGPYMLFQFGAAVLAGEIVNTLLANNASYGTSLVQDAFTTVDAMYMEAILTFVLVFTILSLSPRGHVAGLYAALATGAAFALCILVGAVISTGSMNPSRSVGTWLINRPARYAVWPFVAGPFIGATIAAIVAWSLVGRQNTFWSLSHSHDNDLTTQSMGKYRQPVARGLSPAKTYWFSASGPALIAPTTAAPVTIAAH